MDDLSRVIVIVAGSLAGLLHVWFWVVETLLWHRPAVQRSFGIRGADHAAVARPVFFNLGFYNLFLGLGALAGVVIYAFDRGAVLLIFTMLFMVGAAVVLLASSRGSMRGPALQGIPAVVVLLGLAFNPGAVWGPALEATAAPGAVPRVTATAHPPTPSPEAPTIIGGVESVEIVSRTDIVTGLEIPWALAFAPDGSLLVTERERGRILRVADGTITPLSGPGAEALAALARDRGEGGLLGIALLPSDPTVVYVYQTRDGDNAVLRMTLSGDELSVPVEVLTGIPVASNHNGGRLKFGPDGFLYVTTGDAANGNLSQDRDSLAGKTLRIVADGTDADGSPAPGNPFDSEVWSWGHRNVQGIAWVADGRMFASEFGQGDVDELNQVTAGANYGWPTVEGLDRSPAGTVLGATVDGLTYPVIEWRPTSSASPSGIAATREAIYIAGLRGEALFRVPLTADGVGTPTALVTDLGRIRDVVVGPDGALYLATNNTDGRGTPRSGDDRIVRIEIAPS